MRIAGAGPEESKNRSDGRFTATASLAFTMKDNVSDI
jgi:hypothetical protein